MDFGLQNKRALVTGGASGLGKAIALALASEGCRVLATGLHEEEIDQFRLEARQIESSRLDVTEEKAVVSLLEKLDRLDILVNAAGTIRRHQLEHDPAEFAKVVEVNLNGTMRMCAACHPLLGRSRGNVLNIASMLSFFGSGFVPGYSASKGGIVQLTKSLAIAWAAEGIRVNAIAPGWIETPMTRPLLADAERNRSIIERTPMKRWGKPEEVTGAALFLCSAQAAFITGAILPVDGGYSSA